MEKITGYVDHIVFRNEDNGYTVKECPQENTDQLSDVAVVLIDATGSRLKSLGEGRLAQYIIVFLVEKTDLSAFPRFMPTCVVGDALLKSSLDCFFIREAMHQKLHVETPNGRHFIPSER